MGNIPSDVLREIVRRAGVHIYCEGASPVYVNDRIIGIHVRSDEEKIILPQKSSAKELFSGEYIPETEMITIKNQNGKVKLFLLK